MIASELASAPPTTSAIMNPEASATATARRLCVFECVALASSRRAAGEVVEVEGGGAEVDAAPAPPAPRPLLPPFASPSPSPRIPSARKHEEEEPPRLGRSDGGGARRGCCCCSSSSSARSGAASDGTAAAASSSSRSAPAPAAPLAPSRPFPPPRRWPIALIYALGWESEGREVKRKEVCRRDKEPIANLPIVIQSSSTL